MILLLSGEGPTDLGASDAGVFTAGPMTALLLGLLEPLIGYDLETCPDSLEYVHKTVLLEDAEQTKGGSVPRFRGKKAGAETRFFYDNARAFGRLAKRKAEEACDDVIAVFFRDTDGTGRTDPGEWRTKRKSVHDGFNVEGFSSGVPMLPQPKSEAWLLCLFGACPHSSCASLEEELSGNDASPKSAKSQLIALLGEECSGPDLADRVKAALGAIEKLKDMPSFAAFEDDLDGVVQAILRQ
ncbi:hypothetical protein [Novispirillum itersonii]|uniref:Uncharacterized protein n=1 Tax=Novispirillum itersonii TaxID=189 RepID=A0A7X0DNF9_NOVIT|nr:hypothetical protein [Novispirillum itersonii]MBB6210212.1 hypothetical protein [Novispirillum itersonii]